MKKQIISLVLIALMALTVLSAVTVTTAKHVDAAPPKYYTIALTQNGKWTQCNLHETQYYQGPSGQRHVEWSRGNTAFAYGASIESEHSGEGHATVGVKLRLNTGELTWEDVQEIPIVVKITMRENLIATGTRAFAGVGLMRPFQPSLDAVSVMSGAYPGHNVAITAKTATFTVDTWNGRHLQVSDLFRKDPELGIVGGIPCVVGGLTTGRPFQSSYTATVTIDNIQLLWPEPVP